MNICKKIGAALMMVLMASSVSAQNAELTIDPVNIAPGEEAEIVVNYKGDMPFANIQMDITLPEGLSFVEQEYVNADDEIEYVYALKGTALYSTHNLMYKFRDETQKVMRFLIAHTANKGVKNEGSLFSIKVKADESLADASEIGFSTVIFSGMQNGELFGADIEDFTVAVTKSTPTAISGIEANAEKVQSFNLAGQKVSANAKGIRIQNGKKLVK